MAFLNAREWAVVVWLSIFIGVMMMKGDVRRAGYDVFKAALNRKLVTLFLVCWAYTATCVALLGWAGLWDLGQLKTTILWALFATPPALFRVASNAPAPQLVRGWLSDTIAVTVLIELIALTFVFDFWQEMLLVPVAFFISGLIAFASREARHKAVLGFLQATVAIFGLFLIARGVWMIAINWNSFATLATVRDAYMVPLLSLMTIPFLYSVYLYSAYETAFSGLRGAVADPDFRRYAKWRSVSAFHVNVDRLRRWARDMQYEKPTTRQKVSQLVAMAQRAAERAETRALVPEAEGWCPVTAREFLAKQGFQTGEYRESFGEWYASSPVSEIGEGVWPHDIAFYVEGEERRARRLALKLNLNQREGRPEAIRVFLGAADVLVSRALHLRDTSKVRGALREGALFEAEVAGTRVRLVREAFPNQRLEGHSLCIELLRSGLPDRAASSP